MHIVKEGSVRPKGSDPDVEDFLSVLVGELEGLFAGKGSVSTGIVRTYRDVSVWLALATGPAYRSSWDPPSSSVRRMGGDMDRDGAIGSQLLNELVWAIDSFAPEGMYFGARAGDSFEYRDQRVGVYSDIGWWRTPPANQGVKHASY
jgi:hypothetical protein